MNYRRFLCGCVLLLATLLSGCGRFLELDETAFIFTITVDKGEKNNLQVGVRLPVPRLVGKIQGQAAGSGGGAGQEPYGIVKVDAANIMESLTMLQLVVGRELSLEHLRTLVVSEDVARDDIEEIIRPLIRNPEVRSTTLMYISRGNAFRLMTENNPTIEVNASKFAELVARLGKTHGLSAAVQLGDFYSKLATDSTAIAPITSVNETVAAARKAQLREQAGGPQAPTQSIESDIKAKQEVGKPPEKPLGEPPKRTTGSYLPGHLPREGGNPPEFIGLAIFEKGKMVGVLNGNGALAYNLITGNFDSARVTVSEPKHAEHMITFRCYKGRSPKLAVKLPNDKPKIDVKIIVDCDVEAIPSGERLEDLPHLPELGDAISAQLTRWIEATVRETQDMGADIFGFGRHTRGMFLTWGEWRKLDWQKAYKQASINIEVAAHVRRPGLIIGTASAQ